MTLVYATGDMISYYEYQFFFMTKDTVLDILLK